MTGTIKNGKLVSLQSGHFPQLFTGLDASKPTPGLGDYYFTIDNGKIYVCFVAGYWTLIESQGSEEYHNHLGNVDNYIQSVINGSGTATEDSTNHEMDLAAGALTGYAIYQTKDTFTPSSNRIVTNIKIDNYTTSSSGVVTFWIGFKADFSIASGTSHFAGIYRASSGLWYAAAFSATGSSTLTSITINDGDIVGVGMTSSIIEIFQNGALVKTLTSDLPSAAMRAGASIIVSNDSMDTETLSIDNIMIRRY